jgi:hypothetical protein
LSAGIYKKVWAAEARAMGSMEEFWSCLQDTAYHKTVNWARWADHETECLDLLDKSRLRTSWKEPLRSCGTKSPPMQESSVPGQVQLIFAWNNQRYFWLTCGQPSDPSSRKDLVAGGVAQVVECLPSKCEFKFQCCQKKKKKERKKEFSNPAINNNVSW